MKRQAAILPLLLLLAALCGCGSRTRVSARLDALDTLVVDYPDSVLAVLQSIRPQMENESESLRMQYQLLCIKADFCVFEHPQNDSTVLSVLHYYEHHKDKYLTAEAYYYTGRTYASLGDALQAIDYYKQVLEMAPEDIEDRKITFLRGCTYSQMGTLLVNQNLYEQALSCYQMVYRYDQLLNKQSLLVCDELDLSSIYYNLNMKDSALFYLDKAEKTAVSSGDTASLNNVRFLRVNYYRLEGDYRKALELNSLLIPCVNFANGENVYYVQGELHLRLNQLDSSKVYFQKVLELPHAIPLAKENASKALGEIAMKEGRQKDAVSHFNDYIYYSDSTDRMQKKEALLKVYELYNYNLRERENQRLTLDNVRKTYLIVTLLLALLLLATVSMLVVRHHHRLSQIERMRKQIAQEQDRHHQQLAALVMQKKELEIEQKNIRLSYLRRYIEKHSDIIERLSSVDSSAESFVRLTDAEWERLAVALDEYDENFVSRLRSSYPSLDEQDVRMCMLQRLHLTNRQMANVFVLQPQSVTKRKQRLKKILAPGENDVRSFDEIVSEI